MKHLFLCGLVHFFLSCASNKINDINFTDEARAKLNIIVKGCSYQLCFGSGITVMTKDGNYSVDFTTFIS